MNILAIDTSTNKLALGLWDNQERLVEYNIDSEKQHAQKLLPAIKKALKRLNLKVNDIDCFAVGLGPGSFTGLRIGLSTIKAFAFDRSVPVVGLSILDILAWSVRKEGDFICPLIDARRSLLFTAAYNKTGQELKRKIPYSLIGIDELLEKLKGQDKNITFLGDGLISYEKILRFNFKKSVFLKEDTWYPKGRALIEFAQRLIKQGKTRKAKTLKPIYLYPKDCQVKRVHSL